MIEQPSTSDQTPPFIERLKIDKGVEKHIVFPDYDMTDELKNVCIKIPLLQNIKEIPIFGKKIRELSIKRPGRKRKEVKRIPLNWKIADIMMGKKHFRNILIQEVPL